MKLEDIAAFVAVVRCESVTGAAESLLLQQPAISRRVQNLESDLGATLLDRQTKPLKPTAMGQRIFEQCLAILRDVKAVEGLVQDNSPPASELHMGVTEVIAELVLLNVFPAMSARYPELTVRITTGWSNDVVASVRSGLLDAATVLMPTQAQFPADVSATNIDPVSTTVIARKGTLKRRRYKLHELHEYGWVLNPEGCGFRAGLFRAFADRGLTPEIQADVFDTNVKLGMVAQGVGLGLVPEVLLARSGYADDVDRVAISDFSLNMSVWLVTPRNSSTCLTSPLQEFSRAVSETLQR